MARIAKFLLFVLVLVLVVPALAPPARAELQIDVRRGNFQPIPIAVADFGGEAELGPKVSGIISSNLTRSGYFAPVDRDRFPERPAFDAAPNFAAWRQTGAQGLVTGRVSRDASGRLRAEFRLWDVVAGQQIVGQAYATEAAAFRRVGHLISDAVYSRITGLKGFFDTRIAFVDESGPRERRRKRLAVMDQDGANVRYLTPGQSNVVSPRYSPVTQDIAFMSQASGQQPRVQVINLETGARQVIGEFEDMSSSPRFSPDGRRLLITVQDGGNANIYAFELATRETRRLTNSASIDTSPSYSPDGTQIAFESDRGGKQQIYVMGADGSNPRRISFGEGAYSQPAWSPRGDLIAFTKQSPKGFAIGVMRPDGSGERILTEGFHNEGPTWAPNGQYLVIFRDPGGQSGGKLHMIDVTGRVDQSLPTPSFASDPSWSPLLSGGAG